MRKKLRNKLTINNVQLTMAWPRLLSIVNCQLFILVMMISCTPKDSSHDHPDTYICPMHPTVVSDKPGVCPVCAMDLVRKGRRGEEVKITEDLAKLIKSPNEVVLASIKTAKAEYKSMPVLLTIQGVVTYDTRNIYTIPARVGGRLVKVFLKYNYQPVRKGQKVAEIYSAELVSAQREFLYLLKNDPGNQLLIDAAKSKLLLLGASEKQIDQLPKTQKVTNTFSIFSPHDGFVISDDLPAPASPVNGAIKSSGGMGMGGSANTARSSSEIPSVSASSFVREGSYVTSGQTLFKIVNTNSLWIEYNVPLTQSSQIKVGDKLEWVDQDKTKTLKIDFGEPFFSEGEDFIKLRSYYKGSDISVGQLVEARTQSTSVESLWIPKQALLDLGIDEIVFVKERGLFKPRKVSSGLRTGDWVQIISGLASSDELATNAQYLVDSENFIKTSN
ncbi:MAG TPA: efflux RND transporter periplasmic adaptor subunit [Cyclobacteriaceae bacterium]|mgnify:CR=1 FL=1|nr:efflux RND transporter periplasmic adaptor subunit [Cyclobacteriaceae bacterium]